jgi:hypothetical protein
MKQNHAPRRRTSTPDEPQSDRHLELWVHPAPTATGRYEALVERLTRLAQRDVVDSVEIRRWNRFVSLEGADAKQLSRLRHWAKRHGGHLPAGERRIVGIGRMGPTETVERTPNVVLAEFCDGTLDRVTPYTCS